MKHKRKYVVFDITAGEWFMCSSKKKINAVVKHAAWCSPDPVLKVYELGNEIKLAKTP
jgi:hypothetical protein